MALVLGSVIGSFLNVLIYRLPRGESVAFPGSHCTACGTRLRPLDLVPVLSYVLLGGRCRYCRSRISWQYPLVELLTAALWLLSYNRLGLSVDLAFALVLVSSLIVISFIDLQHRRIPNLITLPVALVGLLSSVYGERVTPAESAIGLAIGFFMLLVVSVLSRGGMGLGDAKLLGMIGAWTGISGCVLALFIGAISASVIGLALLVAKKLKRRQPIPFGPYLSLGGLTAYFYGTDLLRLWLG